ncbi:hypothetical protein EW146_g7229 [Bondarzewia mesenterica]|uniref:SET domain-containing protein n=1 Tax=Bondarzewia mesenterica TaxID=1095465 RepID=A0A4S4LLE1_9AGAM|nr:hypothetical protein EW146_g7229 [Bondarzewia mesenterica]
MPSQLKRPKHWPAHIHYIQSQVYHGSVPADVLSFVRGVPSKPIRPVDKPGNTSTTFTVQLISHSTHPACGQYGLFASKKIPPRTPIVDYLGEVHCDERPDSDYDISLYRFQDGVSVGSDASRMGNEARFVNDYRGIRAKPNAEFRDGRKASGELRMSVWSLTEPIKKGDEILVSYGKAWWGSRTSESNVV